jgi:1-acyl-sn-glycerol-3-phosphate acyltransferase
MSASYFIGSNLGKLCLKAFAKVDVQGQEYVPSYGPLLVVSNHLGCVDLQLITSYVDRRIHFMAKEELFKNRIVSALLYSLGTFPLKRDGQDSEAIRWTLRQIAQNRCVGLFPEGTRSRDGSMSRGSDGIAYIAHRSQVSILPMAIWGTEKIPALWRMVFPVARLNLRIGQPFTLPVIEGRLTRPLLKHLTDMVMQRIAVMLPESYRGYYAMTSADGAPLKSVSGRI